ncbi:hypothetical protein [Wolbachia endosymbiont (group E) of Neria commutata]|uniref:hypothetical protein n=1 Tax=Wolbachia endosymbiont (group E) of Neria commutata TaxID=3066149 RepID=UPI0031331B1A
MTNFSLILLLILFPMLALSVSVEKNCNYTYYPKLDSSVADELHVIKQNYYRYGNELKILADARIKEIKETTLNINDTDDKSI